MSKSTTLPLFIILYIFNAAAFLIYVLLQVVLVLKTLEDRWPLGDIFFAAFFFLVAQSILIFASIYICKFTVHYVDGVFFANLFTLLAVMMIFKYWDSITKEDLEFFVGGPITPTMLSKKDNNSTIQSNTSINAQGIP